MSNDGNKDLFEYADENEKDSKNDFDALIPQSRGGQQTPQERADQRELIGAGGPPQPAPENPELDRKELQSAYIMSNAVVNILIRKGVITQRELDKEVEELLNAYRKRRGQ